MAGCIYAKITCTVHVEPAEEGGYVAFLPALLGCHIQGETLEEVIAMAKDVLTGYLECLQAHGDQIPMGKPTSKLVGFGLPLSMSLAQ
jgi:predicted RNase H-like HicB family nuclease